MEKVIKIVAETPKITWFDWTSLALSIAIPLLVLYIQRKLDLKNIKLQMKSDSEEHELQNIKDKVHNSSITILNLSYYLISLKSQINRLKHPLQAINKEIINNNINNTNINIIVGLAETLTLPSSIDYSYIISEILRIKHSNVEDRVVYANHRLLEISDIYNKIVLDLLLSELTCKTDRINNEVAGTINYLLNELSTRLINHCDELEKYIEELQEVINKFWGKFTPEQIDEKMKNVITAKELIKSMQNFEFDEYSKKLNQNKKSQ